MTQREVGNAHLKAARQHAGYASQQALATAMTKAAPRIGLGNMEVSVRQVRRWESKNPPWPRADHQRHLVQVLQLPIDQLGFIAPWEIGGHAQAPTPGRAASHSPTPSGLPLPRTTATVQPTTIG